MTSVVPSGISYSKNGPVTGRSRVVSWNFFVNLLKINQLNMHICLCNYWRATLLITSILLDVDLDLKQTGAIPCQAMQRKLMPF